MNRQLPLLLALCLPAGGCFVPSVDVIPRMSLAKLSGDIAGSTNEGDLNASAATDFDELGLDSEETGFSPRVDLKWLGLHVSLSTLQLSTSGSGTTNADLTLGDTTIGANTDVDSEFDLTAFSAAATWDFAPTDFLEVGIGLGATLFDFDIQFDSDVDSASSEEAVPLPVIAGRVGSKIGPLDVGAVVGFIDVEVDDIDAQFLDIDLHAAYRLLGEGDRFVGRLVVGYRSIALDAEYDDGDSFISSDFTIAGPYVGAMFSF